PRRRSVPLAPRRRWGRGSPEPRISASEADRPPVAARGGWHVGCYPDRVESGVNPSGVSLVPPSRTVAGTICRALVELGVEHAFGVSGGAIVAVWAELVRSGIHVQHCRHEAGAAFAAVEAFFTSGRPAVVFTTTGPGITNALTGLMAARGDGAKVI